MNSKITAMVLLLTILPLFLIGCTKEPVETTTAPPVATTVSTSITEDTTAASNPTEESTSPSEPADNSAAVAEIVASLPNVDVVSMLEFPGVKWGATPEDVKTVLALTEAQVLIDEAKDSGYKLWVSETAIFGQEVLCGMFTFMRNYQTEEYALASIQLYYPDETEMTVIRDVLTEIYGASTGEEGFTRYRISNGSVKSHVDTGFYAINYQEEAEPVMAWWESTDKRADALPVEAQEAMFTSGMWSPIGAPLDPADPSTPEIILEYLERDPAVLLYSTDSSIRGMSGSPYYTKNVVYFDATEYMSQLLRFAQ